MVILECSLGDVTITGALTPETARALGVELQKLGSTLTVAVA